MNRAQTACGLSDAEELGHILLHTAKVRADFFSTLL
jgi:hypothetical protein